MTPNIINIAKQIKLQGGNSYYVGGFVRDGILGIENDDIDICVEFLSFEQVLQIVTPFASHITKEAVGGTFAVVKATVDGLDLDFALCRGEIKDGESHTSFKLNFNVTIEEDLKRRDLTINAIAQDILSSQYIDPYNGIEDLKNRIAREVSDAFSEDKLRVLRAARFISRFLLTPTQSLIDLCKTLTPDGISSERFGKEFYKTMKQGLESKPSLFFDFLDTVGWLEQIFTELHALKNIKQSPVHHPEGDAYVHTMLGLDYAKDFITRTAIVCHDLGKAIVTNVDENGKINANGHEDLAIELGGKMLNRINLKSECSQKTVDQILLLASMHMIQTQKGMGNKSLLKRVRTLKEMDLTFNDLRKVCEADNSARLPLPQGESETMLQYANTLQELESRNVFVPIVTGKKLINELGLKPSVEFKVLLSKAQSLQDDGLLNETNWKELLFTNN